MCVCERERENRNRVFLTIIPCPGRYLKKKRRLYYYHGVSPPNIGYLVQDNMIRRSMRRIFESARRLDARYDIWAVLIKRK